jgi:AcrR family transcriptional regulator
MSETPHESIQELVVAARRPQIRDVARAAGVSNGIIYNYFLNKEALVLSVLDRVNQSQRRAADFAEALTADPATFIRTYTTQRLTHLSADSQLLVNPALAQSYVAQIIAPTFAIGEQPFTAWRAAGTVRTRDPRLATRAMAGAVLGLLRIRMLGDSYLHEHWGKVGDVLADLMIHGLAVQEGADHDPSA